MDDMWCWALEGENQVRVQTAGISLPCMFSLKEHCPENTCTCGCAKPPVEEFFCTGTREDNARPLTRIPNGKFVPHWQVVFRKRSQCREPCKRQPEEGRHKWEAARRGWCKQPQPDNELAQEQGSLMWVLAIFPLAWHRSMQEWKVKLLAVIEMESLRHHGCWALKGKCCLSY